MNCIDIVINEAEFKSETQCKQPNIFRPRLFFRFACRSETICNCIDFLVGFI